MTQALAYFTSPKDGRYMDKLFVYDYRSEESYLVPAKSVMNEHFFTVQSTIDSRSLYCFQQHANPTKFYQVKLSNPCYKVTRSTKAPPLTPRSFVSLLAVKTSRSTELVLAISGRNPMGTFDYLTSVEIYDV